MGKSGLNSSQLPPAPQGVDRTDFVRARDGQPQARDGQISNRRLQAGNASRSASRGRSRTRRFAPGINRKKGSLDPLIFPRDKGKSHAPVVDAAAVAPVSGIPSSSKTVPVCPPAVRGNVDQLPPLKTWAVVAKSATKGYNLSYLPPAAVGNRMQVNIYAEILQASDPKWSECLVGYLIGKKLPFKLIEAALKHIWGARLIDIMANDEGFFFFHIPDKEFRKEILDSGPLTIAKVPLVLQQCHPLINLEKKKHETVPIWIRLRNIPYSLWSAVGISAVASAVGKPLYVDSQTEKMKMISYARVCVEVHAGVGLPDMIEVDMLDDIRSVKVKYEWRPSYCPTCISFGHKCPTATTEHQATESPVLGTSSPLVAVPPVLSRHDQPEAPAGETWTEVSSRKKAYSKHPISPTISHHIKQNLESAPAHIRSKPSSISPQPALVCSSVSEEEAGDIHNEKDLTNVDFKEPHIVMSSKPAEAEFPALQDPIPEAVCPAAPLRDTRRAARSNPQDIGLPSSSNQDLLKPGDPSSKPRTTRNRR